MSFASEDASKDPDLADSDWVTGVMGSARFYSAAILTDREGFPVGTLCVWSDRPSTVSDQQLTSLQGIRDAVMDVLNARRRALEFGVEFNHPDSDNVGRSGPSGSSDRREILPRGRSERSRGSCDSYFLPAGCPPRDGRCGRFRGADTKMMVTTGW